MVVRLSARQPAASSESCLVHLLLFESPYLVQVFLFENILEQFLLEVYKSAYLQGRPILLLFSLN